MAESTFTEERIICSMFSGIWKSRCLSTIVALGIPELLCNAFDPVDIQEIAQRTSCRTDRILYRLMRAMAQWGIGEELSHKRFKANRAMELLKRDSGPSLGHMVAYYGSDEIWSAMIYFLEAVKNDETAFNIAHGMTMYDYMYKTKELHYDFNKVKPGIVQSNEKAVGTAQRRYQFADNYDHAMNMLSQLEILDAQPSMFTVYPWGDCKRIMDIGGGEGSFLSQILKSPGCENTHGVLFDFPDVVIRAKRHLANEGLPEDRVTIIGGNVLTDIPSCQEVDAIIVKNLFVVFTEDDMLKTIENSSKLLGKGSKFIIVNKCNPEAGDTRHKSSKTGLEPAFRGIHISILCKEGHFRTRSEWIDQIERLCTRVAFQLNCVYDTEDGPTLFELIKTK